MAQLILSPFYIQYFDCEIMVSHAPKYYTKIHKTFTLFCNTVFWGNI